VVAGCSVVPMRTTYIGWRLMERSRSLPRQQQSRRWAPSGAIWTRLPPVVRTGDGCAAP